MRVVLTSSVRVLSSGVLLVSVLAASARPAAAAAAPFRVEHGVDQIVVGEVHGDVGAPVISGNGRHVVFRSSEPNLVAGVPNGIFIKDMDTGLVKAVNVRSGTTNQMSTTYGAFAEAVVNHDGRYVAFLTQSGDLDPSVITDDDGGWDIYLRDTVANTTKMVTRSPTGTGGAGGSHLKPPVITPDGRYVVFISSASLVTPAATGTHVYRYDRTTQTVEVADVDHDGSVGAGAAGEWPVVSDDGRYVAFPSLSSTLVAPGLDTTANSRDIFIRDMTNDVTALVSKGPDGTAAGGDKVRLAANGSRAVFVSHAALDSAVSDTNGHPDVFSYDRASGTVAAVSVTPAGTSTGNGGTGHPSISGDGSTIAFSSNGSNYVTGMVDRNKPNVTGPETLPGLDYVESDLFVRKGGVTRLATHLPGSETVTADQGGVESVISYDGRVVGFMSPARDLVRSITRPHMWRQMYAYDTVTHYVRPVSVGQHCTMSMTPGGAWELTLSRDGRYAAYHEAGRWAIIHRFTLGPPDVAPRSGYWMLGTTGAVHAFGQAKNWGSARGSTIVDIEPTPCGNGYWTVDRAGSVSYFGDAAGYDYSGPSRPNGWQMEPGESVTSMSANPVAGGFWLFTDRGRVISFGNAPFLKDMSGVPLNGPVLDSIATPTGKGYYMVASDGGIFAFGDAKFAGSMGGRPLNAPVESLVPDSDNDGYWLVASDGGLFAFNAPFRGSMGGQPLNQPITGMVRFGNAYLMVASDGGIFNFATNKAFFGSLGGNPPPYPITAVAALEE